MAGPDQTKPPNSEISLLAEVLPPKQFRHITGLAMKRIAFNSKQLSAQPPEEWYGILLDGIDKNDKAGSYRVELFERLAENVARAKRQPLVDYFSSRYAADKSEWRNLAVTASEPKPTDAKAIARNLAHKVMSEKIGLKGDTIAENIFDAPPEVLKELRQLLRNDNLVVGEPEEGESGHSCYYFTIYPISLSEKAATELRTRQVREFSDDVQRDFPLSKSFYSKTIEIPDDLDDSGVQQAIEALKVLGYEAKINKGSGGYGSPSESILLSREANDTGKVTDQFTLTSPDRRGSTYSASDGSPDVVALRSGDLKRVSLVEDLITSHDLRNLLIMRLQQGDDQGAIDLVEAALKFEGHFRHKYVAQYLHTIREKLGYIPSGQKLNEVLRTDFDDRLMEK